MTIDSNTSSVDRDDEAYLVNPDDWNEGVAQHFATEESLELDDEIWSVINFMRSHYNEHSVAPDVRHAVKALAAEKGYEKKEAKKRMFTLFPYGYVKQACKIAGMKRPRGWSTG
ncbi:MAG: TusE/DsrC/DsvC family sulfur relay protein [Ectothiorhodospiraceae bacterium]|nr:TusE/DsrC/DsvC family sulfur relay protein [Ectothiorhodospiraceae bacterium]